MGVMETNVKMMTMKLEMRDQLDTAGPGASIC